MHRPLRDDTDERPAGPIRSPMLYPTELQARRVVSVHRTTRRMGCATCDFNVRGPSAHGRHKRARLVHACLTLLQA